MWETNSWNGRATRRRRSGPLTEPVSTTGMVLLRVIHHRCDNQPTSTSMQSFNQLRETFFWSSAAPTRGRGQPEPINLLIYLLQRYEAQTSHRFVHGKCHSSARGKRTLRVSATPRTGDEAARVQSHFSRSRSVLIGILDSLCFRSVMWTRLCPQPTLY